VEALSPVTPASAPALPSNVRALRADFDPFVAPSTCVTIGDTLARARVAVAGQVVGVTDRSWVGTDGLEVTLDDGTGILVLAFFGRRRITGVEVGRRLTAGGTIGLREGRKVMLNPQIWITPRT
jgi:hypothetical protein